MDRMPPDPVNPPQPSGEGPRQQSSNSRLGFLLQLLIPLAILLLIAVAMVAGYLQKWLWMGQLHYTGIFWTLLSVQWTMFAAAFVFVFLFMWVNLRQALRNSGAFAVGGAPAQGAILSRADAADRINIDLTPRLLRSGVVIASLVLAWLAAAGFFSQWDAYLRFRYGGSFGVADPLFGVDVGFYVFQLPFYQLLQTSLAVVTVLAIVGVSLVYGYFRLLQADRGSVPVAGGSATSHISVLLFILVANWAFGLCLDHYELVYSTLGVVYGAGFAADHVTRIALWVMVAVSAVACALLALNVFRPRLRALVVGAGVYLAVYVVGIFLLPAIVQKFIVQPSELAFETPYLKHYIDFTRQAYDLEAIQETSYPALADLTPAVLARNQDTIENIRLWDARPLLQMYQQTQAIRLYYQFYNVGVDRYHLKDGYHQVMLATRELSPDLPAAAQTWVNEYLQFTHGYGLVMNFVSKTVGGGFPQYLLENVPATSTEGLAITQPAIYYGETMPGYRIVATGTKEFDYPKGNDNVYTSYGGTGGIPLDSFWRRVLFAWTQKDINILLTTYIKPESRIQIWRDVQQRVAKVAPFLSLDSDPYPVLSEGKLYWIQDAYTTSDQFPYANPHRAGFTDNLNYLRNSVKVVANMYDGSVQFYVMDPKDPILAAYQRAFPGVFQSLDQLSPDLKSHLRYPEDLFAIQSDEYKTFHMTDSQVFYNREDLWVAPKETYAGEQQPMQPYYILMKLPGSDTLEYLLMTPFTPQNRDNMISWMAARCDFPDYGKKLFYELPKEKLIYGPNQIEAMIDQNPTISQQLTLWDERGSHVIRGKLIVTPIENSFLYIVPIYLQAAGENFPQLKRVIAVAGDSVVMEPTLDEAMASLFARQQPLAVFGTQAASPQPPAADIAAPSPVAVAPEPPAAGPMTSATGAPVSLASVGRIGIAAVQLASIPSEASAKAEWLRLQKRVPGLLGSRQPDITSNVHAGHTSWRLGTSGFEDTAQATQFCGRLRAAGLNCWVTAAQ